MKILWEPLGILKYRSIARVDPSELRPAHSPLSALEPPNTDLEAGGALHLTARIECEVMISIVLSNLPNQGYIGQHQA